MVYCGFASLIRQFALKGLDYYHVASHADRITKEVFQCTKDTTYACLAIFSLSITASDI